MNEIKHIFRKLIISAKQYFSRPNRHDPLKPACSCEIVGDTLPEAAKLFGKLEPQALAILTLKKSVNDLGIPKEDAMSLAQTAHNMLILQECDHKKKISVKHQKAIFFVLHALLKDYNEHVKHHALISIKKVSEHENTHLDIKTKALEALTAC